MSKKTMKVGGAIEDSALDQKEISLENAAFTHGIGKAEVKMMGTGKIKHYPADREFTVHEAHAKKIEDNGWATRLSLILVLLLSSLVGFSQVSLKNYQYPTKLADTVTNAGTGFIQARVAGAGTSTTVQAVFIRDSGTAAGTATLYGSVDGVNYDAAKVPDASTAIPTFTLTNAATQTYIWRLSNVPYLYYRVGLSGGTTMVVRMSGLAVVR